MTQSEFEIIASLFAPLATEKGAFNLADDAALIPASEYVVTKDVIVEGVHFRSADSADLVARKLLRVNLSDLAAKGAKPVGYFLACVWGARTRRDDIVRFAVGLREDQARYRISLFGGDTTRHRAPAPLTYSATFFGAPPRGGMLRRNGAAVGDDVWVSGTIGDAGLGLAALDKREKFGKADTEHLVRRYQLPEPRVTLGGALADVASAAIDVSDGLVADAGHIARASGVGLHIELGRLPLSEAAAAWAAKQDDPAAARVALATFGDDYEVLFTAAPAMRRAVEMAGKVSKTPVARIGETVRGDNIILFSPDGAVVVAPAPGWDHFSR